MKKIKWIMLALVLCLGLVGGAYAYWQETLFITGSVETADFDVNFSDPKVLEEGGNVRFRQGDYYAPGSWSAPLGPDDRGGATGSFAKTNATTLTFNIDNGWPWMTVAGYVDVNNNSGIPVMLEAIRIKDASGALVSTWKYGQADWFYGDAFAVAVAKYVGSDFNGPYNAAHYVEFAVGDIMLANTSQTIAVYAYLNDGEKVPTTGTDYEFTVEMDWVQWNKPATP